ncbi:Zn(2)-C6 fungal-type domain-containing protein [Mycena venus]|uniref:Zn(2)-C6 fungal-type domain-containing protein n=1 Tax=Mycena venus TaxID=2733690 RepID=A0A8H6YWC9_9AGAR|nr:Zn(2)-C6 fungal-type domain-containing protein [Mycena venus]
MVRSAYNSESLLWQVFICLPWATANMHPRSNFTPDLVYNAVRHAHNVGRRKWQRCDGRRPVCGPCSRRSHPEECEYVTNNGRSREQILEEEMRRIESRIYELEHPAQAAGASVALHHPYAQPQRGPHGVGALRGIDFTRARSPGATSAGDTWWDTPEPPPNIIQDLMDAFIPYASDWGFFLDTSDFRRRALLPLPIGHHSRPSPALLMVVFLLGITLTTSPTFKAQEKTFLARALSALPQSLSGIHPWKTVHGLQAEILLANYFYASARFLEAKYHTAAAVSLALGTVMRSPSAAALRSGRVEVAEDKRMDACWATIIFDKSWAAAPDTCPNLPNSDDMLGLVEMPRLVEDYVDSASSAGSQCHNDPEQETPLMSAKTFLARAVILWEFTNRVILGWRSGTNPVTIYLFNQLSPLVYGHIAAAVRWIL